MWWTDKVRAQESGDKAEAGRDMLRGSRLGDGGCGHSDAGSQRRWVWTLDPGKGHELRWRVGVHGIPLC